MAVVMAAVIFPGVGRTSEPIRIGVAGAHSGDLASYGIPTVRAAELVVRDVNAAGGLLGREVKLLVEVDFALDVLKVRKIAVIHDKGDYGKGLAEFARKFLEESGKAEVVLYEGITPGAVDYSAVVQKVRRKGAEAVIFGGYHPEASKIVRQMRKKRMDTIFISDDGVKDDTFIKVAGKYAEGVYATGPKDVSRNPPGGKGQ